MQDEAQRPRSSERGAVTPAPDTNRPAEEMRETIARVGFNAWYGRPEYDEHPVQGMWERVADALLAGPLAQLQADLIAARKERDEIARTLEAWFNTKDRSTSLAVPKLEQALEGYLRTCRCGGMEDDFGEAARAVLVPFLQSQAGAILAPIIHELAEAEAAQLRSRLLEAEQGAEAMRDALDQAEACLSIVAPRSDKAEYLRTLGVIRAALVTRIPAAEQPAAWPAGCIKPNSCARNRRCQYVLTPRCLHGGKDLTAEVEAAHAALNPNQEAGDHEPR